MKRFLNLVVPLCLALLAGIGSPARAADIPPGKVLRIDTRPGVSVPVYALWRKDAASTLILFSGGAGGYGKIGDDGWPGSGNFLIRTGPLWAAHPFNLVMVGRPSDGIDLGEGHVRVGEKHLADNLAILRAVKDRSPAPVWLVGTSMGTLSAAATAIGDHDRLVAGVVLTSSVTGYRVQGAVPTQDLGRIQVPTLVVHHEQDACKLCAPHEAKNIARLLTAAPVRKTVMVNGGSGETGNPCEAMHFHGYIGIEQTVVDLIADWIRQPAP